VNLDCQQICELMDSYLSEELSVETNHAFLRHVAECRDCAAELKRRRRLRALLSETLDLPVDAGVLLFTGAVAVLTALLFGTLPACRAGRSDAEGAWREPARGAAGGSVGASNALIVVQVAISLVLLVAAGLFLRTLAAITNRELGFRSEGVLVVKLYAWQSGIALDQFVPLADRIRASVVELPGVDPSEIQVVAADRVLVVAGVRQRQPLEGRYQQMEIEYGPFQRRIPLDEPVDTNAARARYEHGLLTVVLPIATKAPAIERVLITIAGPA